MSVASTKSDVSKAHTKTDSISSDIISKKLSQESPVASVTGDSLADVQQSTEKDVSFVSQTDSKVIFNIAYFLIIT